MRPTLIVNPYSTHVTEARVRLVEQRLGAVETLLTERKGHATELAGQASGDAVFAFGGDGLLNEVLNGLPADKPMGIVAGGHTNVLARLLRIPSDPGLAVNERRISLGRVNGRRFAFAAGIGVDADAVRELDTVKRSLKGRRPGDVAYARVVTRKLLGGYDARLDIEGHGRASMAFVSNHAVYTYAGPVPLKFSPSARFELGLDLVAPERGSRGANARLAGRVAIGRGLEGAKGVISIHDFDRVRIVCDEPLSLQADGEDLGDVAEVVFESERDAVTVLVA